MNALSLGIGLLSNHDDSESSSVALQEHCSDLTACCDAVLHLLEDVLAMEQMQSGQCVEMRARKLHWIPLH